MDTDIFLLNCERYAELDSERCELMIKLGECDGIEHRMFEIEDALESNRVERRVVMWSLLGPKQARDYDVS